MGPPRSERVGAAFVLCRGLPDAFAHASVQLLKHSSALGSLQVLSLPLTHMRLTMPVTYVLACHHDARTSLRATDLTRRSRRVRLISPRESNCMDTDEAADSEDPLPATPDGSTSSRLTATNSGQSVSRDVPVHRDHCVPRISKPARASVARAGFIQAPWPPWPLAEVSVLTDDLLRRFEQRDEHAADHRPSLEP